MKPASTLLGIDAQKLRLGFALVYLDDGDPLPWGCDVVTFNGDQGASVRHALMHVRSLSPSIRLIYVEAPHVGASRRGAVEHAMAVGRALQQCEMFWPTAPIQLIHPSEWRQLVGLPGNAAKSTVAARARELGFDSDSQDALDAAMVAIAGWRRNQEVIARASSGW